MSSVGVHTKTHKYENDMYQNDFIESVIYLLAHTKTHYYYIKHREIEVAKM